jgi:hypothetical protein
MGYRAHWLNHAGAVSTHNEATLHAFDREIQVRPGMSVLLVGVGNGGGLEIWQALTPDGTVKGLDPNPACQSLPGVTVIQCDPTERDAVRAALRGSWWDAVIDSTGTMQPYVWPFLRPGGTYVYEGYNVDMSLILVRDLALEDDSWLPIEEVMRVDTYQSCLVIEKRNPRVVPYMDVVTGNFADVIPEADLYAAGMKRVIPA